MREQPDIIIPDSVTMPRAEVRTTANGVKVYRLDANEFEVVRFTLVFRAGSSMQHKSYSIAVDMTSFCLFKKKESPIVLPARPKRPKIAISVYIEHGGFGAEIALPIASLIEELYLTDTITRPDMVEKVLNFTPNYSRNYDAKQRTYDMKREEEQRKKQKK